VVAQRTCLELLIVAGLQLTEADKRRIVKDMLKRHKLLGNMKEPNSYYVIHNRTKIARSARAVHTYRQFVHGVNEARLPATLRHSVHYFLTQMTRADSDNSRDRKGLEPANKVETEVLV
jgi:hypothetical protein